MGGDRGGDIPGTDGGSLSRNEIQDNRIGGVAQDLLTIPKSDKCQSSNAKSSSKFK
jgi:hypothetical protein